MECVEGVRGRVRGRPFVKGADPRRGPGPAPGFVPKPRPVRMVQEAVVSAQEATAAAHQAKAELEALRASLEPDMLARHATTPALRHLLDVVEDPITKPDRRDRAAAALLQMGWSKAPNRVQTESVSLTVALGITDAELIERAGRTLARLSTESSAPAVTGQQTLQPSTYEDATPVAIPYGRKTENTP